MTAHDDVQLLEDDRHEPDDGHDATYPELLLLSAIEYARRGFAIFPLSPGSKTPALTGWNDPDSPVLCTSEETARAWWQPGARYAGCGIAIATGHPIDGGYLYVYDVDVPKEHLDKATGKSVWTADGYEYHNAREKQHGRFGGLQVDSPTGGLHRYLITDSPMPCTASKYSIDTRGKGGYIVAPPTVLKPAGKHPGGPYVLHTSDNLQDPLQPAPAWLLADVQSWASDNSPAVHRSSRPQQRAAGSTLPGDIFDMSCNFPLMLSADGWQHVKTRTSPDGCDVYITRPGKDIREGHSAVLHFPNGGTAWLKNFSGNAWLRVTTVDGVETRVHLPGAVQGSGYTAFAYWAHTRFEGSPADRQRAAARHLREKQGRDGALMLGYGMANMWLYQGQPMDARRRVIRAYSDMLLKFRKTAGWDKLPEQYLHSALLLAKLSLLFDGGPTVSATDADVLEAAPIPSVKVADPLEAVEPVRDDQPVPAVEPVQADDPLVRVDDPHSERNTPDLPLLPTDFWNRTRLLQEIAAYAKSRKSQPDQLLGALLAMYSALVPHTWRIPDLTEPDPDDGDTGWDGDSMNLFVLMLGSAQNGKSKSIQRARRILSDLVNVDDLPMGEGIELGRDFGSGQGVASAYYDAGLRKNASVLFEIDEAAKLEALAQHTGSTLLAVLRAGYMGQLIDKSLTNGKDSYTLKPDTYRLSIIGGIQPTAAAWMTDRALIDQGTPQRFLFVAADADLPPVGVRRKAAPAPRIACPPRLDPAGTVYTMKADDQVLLAHDKAIRERCNLGAEHRHLRQNKVGCVLALMHNRRSLDIEMWNLAGEIVDNGLRVFDYIGQQAAIEANRKHQASVARHVDRELQTDTKREASQLQAAAATLARAIHRRAGEQIPANKASQYLTRKHRELFTTEQVTGEAVAKGWLGLSDGVLIPGDPPPAAR